MVVAVLVFFALEALCGGTSLNDLPTTRKGWRNLFIVVLVLLIVIATGVYLVLGRNVLPSLQA